jgi:hypothetical protein
MSHIATMKSRSAMILLLGLVALATAGKSQGADSVSAQRMKADFERKRAEQKRKFEEKKREMPQSQERLRQKGLQDIASSRTGSQAKPQTTAFNAASAPSPGECLLAFVATARTASSMEPLLRFLPDGEQRTLRETQANYDPKQAASGRAWHKKQNPNISEESLTHLSNLPFTNSLKFHKSLAGHIQEILSVKIEGAEAKLVVSTTNGATIDGGYFPYSKADVEMVGEGNSWRLSRYRPSNVYYQELPKKP